jgi:ribosomal protein L32
MQSQSRRKQRLQEKVAHGEMSFHSCVNCGSMDLGGAGNG